MKKLFLAIALIGILGFASATNATVMLAGNAADQGVFVGLLNSFSAGGIWAAPGGNLGFTVIPALGPINNFASRINFYDNDPAALTLDLGRNQGGVLVGAFLGGGTQQLDLNDIAMFPANTAANPVLDLQSALILHEVSEVFSAVAGGMPNNFPPAHLAAITEENSELTFRGSRGRRGGPPDQVRAGPLPGILDLIVPWSDTANPLISRMIIRVRANNITNIRSGLLDTGFAYDGTEEDISIESIFLEPSPVPEPSSILLIGSGAVILWLRNRRKKD